MRQFVTALGALRLGGVPPRSLASLASGGTVGPATAGLLAAVLVVQAVPMGPAVAGPATAKDVAPASQAARAFQQGEYDHVIRLFQEASLSESSTVISPALLRLATLSYIRLGQPETALPLYHRLIPAGTPDDRPLLAELAWSMVSGHARDGQEHVRLAVYSVLAETRNPAALPILEDGLLDRAVIVRARAVEALGRSLPAARAGTVSRMLGDSAPTVRIAAMTAVGELRVTSVREQLVQIARRDEGPESVFATGALIRLGREDMLAELMNAASDAEPEIRMAALGVLGKLKRPNTLATVSQAVYDPDPAVRAFAAGALGEFGLQGGIAALTHALADEDPRVRSMAAAGLGRIGGAHARQLLQPLRRDADDLVRATAIEGLLRAGEPDIMLMAADLAKHAAPMVRATVAQSVGIPGNKSAIALLEQLLRDQQPQARLASARALGRIGPVALPAIKRALEDSEPAVRVTAAGSLLHVIEGTRKGKES